jgi:hypothetical protein
MTLPLELILAILEITASCSSTRDARNICLVSKAAYNRCWPSLHRIIALRDAKQLKSFSEDIYRPELSAGQDEERHGRLRKRQDAVEYLYLNNNKDSAGFKELQTDERPEMWMISILLAAKNLKVMHIEEYWSISYPCVTVPPLRLRGRKHIEYRIADSDTSLQMGVAGGEATASISTHAAFQLP